MIVKLHNLGAIGMLKDLPAWEIPQEAWTSLLNVRALGDKLEKVTGEETVFNVTVSAATATQNLAEAPWFVMPVQGTNIYYWLYAGQQYIHAVDKDRNQINLNKTASGSTVTYSSTTNIRWNGAVLGGLPILNNGVDPPQIQLSLGFTQRFQDLQWDASAGTTWANRSAGAVVCKVFRTFREYGIALNTTENGTAYPRRVRWSHPAVPGTQPTSWDENRTDIDASYKDLEETGGEIKDCKRLYDFNVVYKTDSCWIQQYIGGQYVFAWRKLFDNVGLLSTNCVENFKEQHFVVTDSDVVVHNGQTVESVLHKRLRKYLFSNIDSGYYKHTFTAHNVKDRELWICYPESGVTSPFFPDKALIWNYHDNTWYERELAPLSHIENGIIEFAPEDEASPSYISIGDTYADSLRTYGEQQYSLLQYEMLGACPSAATPKLLRLNSGADFDGIPFTSRIERESIGLVGADSRGNPRVAFEPIKHCRGIWPYINATEGTEVQISIGSQWALSDPISWDGPYTFIVGTSRWIRCRVTGRLLSFRIQTTTESAWSLSGLDIDIVTVGKR